MTCTEPRCTSKDPGIPRVPFNALSSSIVQAPLLPEHPINLGLYIWLPSFTITSFVRLVRFHRLNDPDRKSCSFRPATDRDREDQQPIGSSYCTERPGVLQLGNTSYAPWESRPILEEQVFRGLKRDKWGVKSCRAFDSSFRG